MGQGALFWPARKALLIADLHLEKASFFARFGQMLPPYDSNATLAAIEALVDETGARELRSEEHTSELQSLMRISYAVFCLKKKQITKQHDLHCTIERILNEHT